MEAALAVFAKRPVPGQVKTRLTPALSPEAAAALYWAMVEDTWAIAASLPGIEPHLFVDQPWQGFDALANGHSIHLQSGESLGIRIFQCFQSLRCRDMKFIVIIGTDSPTLPKAYVQAAFELLKDANDAVLGPAEDGGYYLVGCCRPHPGMFDGVAWSSPETHAQTQSAFAAQGYQTHLTPSWHDVDSVEDLHRLAQGPTGPSVQAWLRQNPL